MTAYDVAAVRGIENCSPTFLARTVALCDRLGMNPDHLLACMSFETGGTFSPSIKNPGSSATGLIQFMGSTAAALGTSTAELASMTAEDQLAYVEKYFQPWAGRLHTVADTYMAIFAPSGVGRGDSFVLYASPSSAYSANAGMDANGDGTITVGEAASRPAGILYAAQSRPRVPVELSYDGGNGPMPAGVDGAAAGVGAVALAAAIWLAIKAMGKKA
jgi:hypothetical protein